MNYQYQKLTCMFPCSCFLANWAKSSIVSFLLILFICCVNIQEFMRCIITVWKLISWIKEWIWKAIRSHQEYNKQMLRVSNGLSHQSQIAFKVKYDKWFHEEHHQMALLSAITISTRRRTYVETRYLWLPYIKMTNI